MPKPRASKSAPAVGWPPMLLLSGAAAVWLATGFAGAADATPDFAAKLPAQVGVWVRPAQPLLHDRQTLYDYIDGGAELYLAFDFVRAVTFEYAAGHDDEIKVDIFDMGSARGAFGVFAHGRESVAHEIGQGSEYGGGLLTFWKDRWFVSVLGYPESDAKRKAVYELGRAIAALIPTTGVPPTILGALPKAGLVEASVRTFHHHLLQNDYVLLSHDNPLAIGVKTEAVQARYLRQKERHVLMLVDYPSPADAEQALHVLTGSVLGGAQVRQQGQRWTAAKRRGKRLVLVLGAASKQVANQVLSEVP
jgi:hypothetical protein